ncbi:Mg2+ transporter-C, MgtC family [Lachnoanaerobaculum saburreum F0468]|jgi:mgtC/sapB transporter|uniref:Mg2+ transporter-C, MgtC family n=1 Tax=Lachnoanaerobaculum saburreum F0468 TaxID=1095750 RepID=I0R5T2_9FIRM|nr:MgtC/SapB family protein [Lachnoanaerobaculum saburreum]EIC95040.1 Mg2+ transporter-C, MgtC family [Lachnoanaerobaculum saburreum F0468]RKW53063.1 MAG: MgtC/SapB family protein [Lachnospiraceae bacterium]
MPRELNLYSLIIRIVLSLFIGGILGFDRGRKNRPAGFRTYMLVCLGSTLVMITNQYVFQVFKSGDPVRLGAQVVSGVGFLGAGTIILTGHNQVKGITTAAGIWTAACCGLTIGIGYYEGAVAGGIAVFIVMASLQKLEGFVRKNSQAVELYIEYDNTMPLSELFIYLRKNDLDIVEIELAKNPSLINICQSATMTVKGKTKNSHSVILNLMSRAPGVIYFMELY